MRKFTTALLCTLALLATGVMAGPSPGGYPDMCTDISSLENAVNQGYVTCAEKKAGTSTTYPGYSRVQDGNGTLLVDVFAWTNQVATTTFVRGMATVGVLGFVSGTTWTQAVAGAGAVNAGTQRVTLASDDPAVTALQIMDDWDESDRAKVNPIAGQAGVAAGSGAVDALTQRVTIATDDSIAAVMAKNPWSKLDDDAVSNCVAITDTTAQFTLPGSAGDWYCMDALDNTAYLKCGTNPTVDHVTVGTDWAFIVHEGVPKCRRLTGPKCAVIGTVTAGSLCFEHLNPAL